MQFTMAVFGEGDTLAWWQMSARAALIFIAAWALLRLAGRRSFSQQTSFDLCIMLLLGAVLSRAVVGASPVLGTLAASAVIVMLHRLVGMLSRRYAAFDRVVGGKPMDLMRAGRLDRPGMARAMVSEEDLKANLRAVFHGETLRGVERVVLERNGRLTFVRSGDEAANAANAATQPPRHAPP
jgi:uncharacterized membrane protein YcaP (DUF421 family)